MPPADNGGGGASNNNNTPTQEPSNTNQDNGISGNTGTNGWEIDGGW